jgi:histidyl-tRNA synthetase
VRNATFDITLMRGLDYYTGTVFEFFDTHPENNRSLFGGGRYSGLVGLFGVEPVTAVGFAPGLTMMQLFLETHNLLPKLYSPTDVYMIVIGDSLRGAMLVARELRAEGVNVELDFTDRKIDKQLKTADKKGIPYVMFVGETELKSEVFTLKNIITGTEQKLSLERVVSAVKDHRIKRSSEDEEFDLDIAA